MNKTLITSLLCLVLAACTLGPDFEKPALPVQDNFQGIEGYDVSESAALMHWQQAYQDPQLQQLIELALAQNYDLAMAVSRIKEARARANMLDSALYPSLGLLAESERVSKGSASDYDDSHQLKGQFAWELDLFGYNRRASEAAWAELTALGQARNIVEMNLVADVASTYFEFKDFN